MTLYIGVPTLDGIRGRIRALRPDRDTPLTDVKTMTDMQPYTPVIQNDQPSVMERVVKGYTAPNPTCPPGTAVNFTASDTSVPCIEDVEGATPGSVVDFIDTCALGFGLGRVVEIIATDPTLEGLRTAREYLDREISKREARL